MEMCAEGFGVRRRRWVEFSRRVPGTSPILPAMAMVSKALLLPALVAASRVPLRPLRPLRAPARMMAATSGEMCEGGIQMQGVNVQASTLRDMMLTDSRGAAARVGDRVGNGRSVVVFMRHLG